MPRTNVAQFEVSHLQVLDEGGNVDDELPPEFTDEQHLELYAAMKRSRRLDERAIALQRRGELGTYVPAIGQEATQIGSATRFPKTIGSSRRFANSPRSSSGERRPKRC